MQPLRIAILLVLLIALVCPAMAEPAGQLGYLSVERVDVALAGPDARITVDYDLDGGMGIIVMLLGKSDLERKVQKVINYEEARTESIGLTRAVFSVKNASHDYAGGAYWYPGHEFGIRLPLVRVITPQYIREFPDTALIPKGMGYFGR